jgi:hypothetical protein
VVGCFRALAADLVELLGDTVFDGPIGAVTVGGTFTWTVTVESEPEPQPTGTSTARKAIKHAQGEREGRRSGAPPSFSDLAVREALRFLS